MGAVFFENALLFLLLDAFFLKGVFLAALFPLFTGQDEARHYNTIQYIAEPFEKTWPMEPRAHKENKNELLDYNFSQEIIGVGQAAEVDAIRGGIFRTADFSSGKGYDGKNENTIREKSWQPRNTYSPPDIATPGLYHRLGAFFEWALSGHDLLVRFYAIRIMSVALGTVAIFLAFMIARALRFDRHISLLFAALVAFQPKFSMYTTNINYDALLIPTFFLFTLGGILSLRDGLTLRNGAILLVSTILGVLTKQTAFILLPVLFILLSFHLLRHLSQKRSRFLSFTLFFLVLIGGLSFLASHPTVKNIFPTHLSRTEILTSFEKYRSESLTPGRLALSSRTYWGALGWNEDIISRRLTDVLWPIEGLAAIGLLIFFIFKKPEFLPEKRLVAFLVLMILALQLGIRAADWSIFRLTGALDLGAPGRYFLPNLATHFLLVFIGFGALVRSREFLRHLLVASVILFFAFSFYLTVSVVAPRFYL
ncbi:MAG: glycosyltransferase family 39 protein [Candidatus Moraniibacteriota bacterium]|nr:MAG: glycosyltransferase family 39 protein [Candidatus Moranbacteria bacterium]